MLQQRERAIQALRPAAEVTQHQVLVLAAKANAQRALAACDAKDSPYHYDSLNACGFKPCLKRGDQGARVRGSTFL